MQHAGVVQTELQEDADSRADMNNTFTGVCVRDYECVFVIECVRECMSASVSVHVSERECCALFMPSCA